MKMILATVLALASFQAGASCQTYKSLPEDISVQGQPVSIVFAVTELGRLGRPDVVRTAGEIGAILSSSNSKPQRGVNQSVCREVSYIAARSSKYDETTQTTDTTLFPGRAEEGTKVSFSTLDDNKILLTANFTNIDKIVQPRKDNDASVVTSSATQASVIVTHGKQTHMFKADGKRYRMDVEVKDTARDETD